jgi:hypothetical protein
VASSELYAKDDFLTMAEDGGNGMHLAASGVKTIKWFQSKGAHLQLVNFYGRTPLTEAALVGQRNSFFYLWQAGSDVKLRDTNGMRAYKLSMELQTYTDERESRQTRMIDYMEPVQRAQDRQDIHAFPHQQLKTEDTRIRGIRTFLRDASDHAYLYQTSTIIV